MPKSEFLHLAHKFTPEKYGIAGWWWSEKLDGQRGFWDGGVSRGIKKAKVPWANTDKDYRFVDQQIATGLWSRYGNVIHAPDWFLDSLPNMLLDGELWSEDKLFRQEVSSIIKRIIPDDLDWRKIVFKVFDSPAKQHVFMTRYIKTINFTKRINFEDCRKFYGNFPLKWEALDTTVFRRTYFRIKEKYQEPVIQNEFEFSTRMANLQIEAQLERITNSGGEGLILRNPDSVWMPWRTHTMLKVKKLDDAEGIVIGYVAGKETDLGSKHLGYIGALILDFEGKRLELAGLNAEERILSPGGFEWAQDHPGQEIPLEYNGVKIPRGTKVTFKFRGKSKDGIPQEARYWRERID